MSEDVLCEACPDCGAGLQKVTIEEPDGDNLGEFVDDCPNCGYRYRI